jgi:hypothetical protein
MNKILSCNLLHWFYLGLVQFLIINLLSISKDVNSQKKKKLNKEFMNPKVVDIEEDKPELLE